MKKQILSANSMFNAAVVYNSVDGGKEDYIVRIPNDDDVNILKKVFGNVNAMKIFDTIRNTYLSIEGLGYKTGADVITLNDDEFIFVVKDNEHNVFVSSMKGDIVYTVFIGHRNCNDMSFMTRFIDFFSNFPGFEN